MLFVKNQQQQNQQQEYYSTRDNFPEQQGNAVDPMQQQNFMNQLNGYNQESILQQKTLTIDNQYQKAEVKKAGFTLPPGCELFLGLIHLGMVIGIIYLCHYWITEFNMFPFPAIGLIIFYIILTCGKMCGSSPAKYLANAKIRGQIDIYNEDMKKTNPIVRYYAEAYHYITVTTGSGKNRRSRRKKVTSYSHYQNMVYTNCTDKSDDLSEIFNTCTLLRVNSKFHWYSGNQLAKNNWEQIVQAERMMAQGKDTYMASSDRSYVPNMQSEQLGFANNIPCYLDKPVMWFFYLFGLGIIFDTWFYSITGSCVHHVQKTVYCENFVGPDLVNAFNVQQQFNMMQGNLQNMQQNMQFQQQQGNNMQFMQMQPNMQMQQMQQQQQQQQMMQI